MSVQVNVFGKTAKYMLAYGDNRKSAKPTIVTLRPMSAAEFKRLAIEKAAAAKQQAKEDAKAGFVADGPESAFEEIDEVVLAHVVDLGGMHIATWDEDGNCIEAPLDVATLVAHGPRELLLELYQAVVDASKLADGVAKKSNSPPAS